MKPYLHLRCLSHEGPGEIQLVMSASNGRTSGCIEFYSHSEELVKWSEHLEQFPRHATDVFLTELGSERPEDRWSCYFRVRAFLADSVGHSALHFRFSNNRDLPHRELSEFCIQTEAASINRLGTAIRSFASLGHQLLVWTPTECELLESASHYDQGS